MQDTHASSVQIQAYNIVDFVLEIQKHAARGYKMNPEDNEQCPQQLGPGLYICGMKKEVEVEDVTDQLQTDKEIMDDLDAQVEQPLEVESEELPVEAVEKLEKNGTSLPEETKTAKSTKKPK